MPFPHQYLITICCWLTISQKQSFPIPLSKISWHCYAAHWSITSKKSQGGYTKNHITPTLTGSHRCYLSARVSTTLRHSHWFFLPKEYGVNDLIIQVFTAQRLLFPSLKGSMWNAAFKESLSSWPFLGGMGTGKLPLKLNTSAVLQPSDARITGYSPTPIESSLAVTPMNYSTSYLPAAA